MNSFVRPFFLNQPPLLDNPGFQLFCSECILTRPLLLNDTTRFLLRSMVISRTGTIQISTLRHKESTESAVLFVSFHIWHPTLIGSSSADEVPSFCMTKSNCLTSLSTYWFCSLKECEMLQPSHELCNSYKAIHKGCFFNLQSRCSYCFYFPR